jgi:hypothetical protein
MAAIMKPPRNPEGAQSRSRAVLRLVLAQAQVIGATTALVLLLRGGVSAPAIWAAVLTEVVSLTSIVLFRLVWGERRKSKQNFSAVQGVFPWPPKM